MARLKDLKEARIHGSWKTGGIAGRTTQRSSRFEDDVDHQAEIDRIETAMKKYPSNNEKIEKQQRDKIEYHRKMLAGKQ